MFLNGSMPRTQDIVVVTQSLPAVLPVMKRDYGLQLCYKTLRYILCCNFQDLDVYNPNKSIKRSLPD